MYDQRDGTASASTSATDETPESPEVVLARIDERAESIRRRELARALSRLETSGSLTDEQRAAVTAMTERLVAGLLGPAAAGLRAASETGDPATVASVRRLFGAGQRE